MSAETSLAVNTSHPVRNGAGSPASLTPRQSSKCQVFDPLSSGSAPITPSGWPALIQMSLAPCSR